MPYLSELVMHGRDSDDVFRTQKTKPTQSPGCDVGRAVAWEGCGNKEEKRIIHFMSGSSFRHMVRYTRYTDGRNGGRTD